MLSLHQLRCFLATYEHGSLTGVYRKRGVRTRAELAASFRPPVAPPEGDQA